MTRLLLIPLLWLAACVTPVIPLPPPSPESYGLALVPNQADRIVISGPADHAYRGSYIFFLNLKTGRGVITQTSFDDGSFRTEVEARDQDRLHIWAARGADEASSDVVCSVVELHGTTGSLPRCP